MKVPLDEGGTLLLRTWNTPPAPEGAQPDTTFSLLSFSGFLSSLCDAPPPSWVLLLSRLRVLCRVSGGSAGSRVPAAAAVCVCPERDDLLHTSARVYSSDYAP